MFIKLSGQNLLRLLVLMGFCLIFYNTLTTPGLSQVIHPQFIWNAKLGFTLLLVLTIIQMFKTIDCHHNITCGCHHKTGQLAYIVFVGTLILGLLVPISPLGSATASQKGVKFMQTDTSVPVSLSVSPADNQPELEITAENHVNYITALYENNTAFIGKNISLKGFVYRPDQTPARHFFVARFEISCCAADAIPSGLFIAWDDSQSIQSDSWVEIHGKLATFTYLGNKLPIVKATQVIPIKPLTNPYVYVSN